ncbi:MAG: c-type cytochrome [Thermoanaerobaculia bacterium]
MSARMGRAARAGLLVAVLLIGGVGFLAVDMLNHGISTRREPRAAEAFVATRLRRLAIPRAARNLGNPEPASPEAIREGMAHLADHCASCHGNDGKGTTDIGRNLYPKAPDMTAPGTQGLSDGELFYIIKNGVRFTGMPAWGDGSPEADRDSWRLVRFLRHLPRITAQELEEMKDLNPISPEEIREQEEEKRFLEGEKQTSSPPVTTHAHH